MSSMVWKDGCDVEPVKKIPKFFSKLIKKQSTNQDKSFASISSPTALQSYAWPAILKLSDFFGIGPSPISEKGKGGKTTSYILPLLRLLSDKARYAELPKYSSSPIVIIICPSYKQVTSVHAQVELLTHKSKVTAYSLYGIYEEPIKYGSDILVCTPCVLLRILKKKAVTMGRVCHLIFEEADILINDFKPQVENIILRMPIASNNRELNTCPRQILVFSQHWTPELDSFVRRNLSKPTIVTESKMEAFYSGSIQMDVTSYCSPFFASTTLTSTVMEQLKLASQQKIVAICDRDDEAELFSKELEAHCQQSQTQMFLVNSSTKDEDFEKIFNVWKDSKNIVIVLCDKILHKIEGVISNSTCVINADVPEEQQVLARRLWLMRDHFQRTSCREKQLVNTGRVTGVRAVVLISEKLPYSSYPPYLTTFVTRVDAKELPQEVEKLRDRSMNQLCDNFKSFGFCSNRLCCKFRHHLIKDKYALYFGSVEVEVTSVKSPYIFNAQIVKGEGEAIRELQLEGKDVEVCLCRLKNVDNDPNWHHVDLTLIENYVNGNTLKGRVVFKMGSTLWIDSVELKYLLHNYLEDEILAWNGADVNPEHIPLLLTSLESCSESEVSSTEEIMSCHGWDDSSSWKAEKLEEKFTAIYVTSVKVPDLFYVQKAVNKKELEGLHKYIDESIECGEVMSMGSTPFYNGLLILVKDGRWKRARVQSSPNTKDDMVLVFLLDFGISLKVHRANILSMPLKFRDMLPFQAIECCFSDLVPLHSERNRFNEELSVIPSHCFLPSVDDDDDYEDGGHSEWALNDETYLMEVTHGNLLTAVLVNSEDEKQAIRLFCYHDGEFITDLSQRIILDGKASLAYQAVEDMFKDVDLGNDRLNIHFKTLSRKLILEENPDQKFEILNAINDCVHSTSDTLAIRGLVKVCAELVRNNYYFPWIRSIMETISDQLCFRHGCTEARTSYLWDSICFIILKDTMRSNYIVLNLLPLLKRNGCEEFIISGGIKAICKFIINNNFNEESTWQGFCILFLMIERAKMLGITYPVIKLKGPLLEDEFLAHHETLNTDSNALLHNYWRDSSPNLEGLMDVITLTMGSDSVDAVFQMAMQLLCSIIQNCAHLESLSKLVEGGGLKNITELLKARQSNMELSKQIVYLLCHMVSRDENIVVYLSEYNVQDFMQETFQDSQTDEEMKFLSSKLLQVMRKENQVECLDVKVDDFKRKMRKDFEATVRLLTTGHVSREAFTKFMPTIKWWESGASDVVIQVKIENVKYEDLNISFARDSITFEAHSDVGPHSFSIPLKYPIDEKDCDFAVRDSDIEIWLTKSVNTRWDQLMPQSNFYVTEDVDAALLDSCEKDEYYDLYLEG